jgi:hypothetical protein
MSSTPTASVTQLLAKDATSPGAMKTAEDASVARKAEALKPAQAAFNEVTHWGRQVDSSLVPDDA